MRMRHKSPCYEPLMKEPGLAPGLFISILFSVQNQGEYSKRGLSKPVIATTKYRH
jgi:hypothetical protein